MARFCPIPRQDSRKLTLGRNRGQRMPLRESHNVSRCRTELIGHKISLASSEFVCVPASSENLQSLIGLISASKRIWNFASIPSYTCAYRCCREATRPRTLTRPKIHILYTARKGALVRRLQSGVASQHTSALQMMISAHQNHHHNEIN